MKHRIAAVACILFVLTIGRHTGTVVGQSEMPEACRNMADLRIEDTNMLSAVVVPASADLPEYCRVLGYVRPAVNFEIRLPTSDWNGKFYMAGCGASCGKLESDNARINAINIGLKRDYAVSTMDGGHWGESISDGRWAYHDRIAEIDFGYRAVHETARVTKVVIEAFYDRPSARSYFQGCSTGGRQANMEAWRYPDDFDGIISGAPDIDATGVAGTTYAWLTQKSSRGQGRPLLTSTAIALLDEAVLAACDSADGLNDGLIDDPRACKFDPAHLQCRNGVEDGCLNPEQVKAVRLLYDGPRSSSGDQLYPGGLPLGSEPFWDFWLNGTGGESPVLQFGEEFLRYMAFEHDPGESFSIADFDFDADPQRLEYMARIYNSDHPDLEAFRLRGGKLLMWQGWSDVMVPPWKTVEYYEAIERKAGSREAAQEFIRLFMVPGMDHCGILDGPGITDSGFDPLTALERWVEEGEAPASLSSAKTDSTGRILWSRPLCPYPQRAVHDGRGDVRDASSFECRSL